MASDLFFNKMNDTIYTQKYKGCLIEICQDEDAQSPDKWDTSEVFLTAYHSDFGVPSDIVSKEECQALSTGEPGDYEVEKERIEELKKKYWHFGLEAYIHSGVSLALSYEGNFPDRRWDVSQLGLVFIAKSSAKTRKRAKKLAEDLIENWNDYLSGNVFGFSTSDDKNGIEIDSCWGFYGDYRRSGIIDEAKDSINRYLKTERKQAAKKTQNFSTVTLGELLSNKNEGITRNAIGILKQLQKSK